MTNTPNRPHLRDRRDEAKATIMKHILQGVLACAMLLTSNIARAQEFEITEPWQDPPGAARFVEISYFGETITHAGLSASFDHVLRSDSVRMSKFEAPRFKQTHRFVGVTGAIYHHGGNHTGALIGPRIGLRRVMPRGITGELIASAGYMHKRLSGAVFTVNDDGEFQEQRVFKARPKFFTAISAGFGFKPTKLLGERWGLHVRPGLFVEYPHNSTFLLHPTLELGVNMELDAPNKSEEP